DFHGLMKKILLLLISLILFGAVSGCMPQVLKNSDWYPETVEMAEAANIPIIQTHIYFGTITEIGRDSFTIGKGKLLYAQHSWNLFPADIENCTVYGGPIYCRQFRPGDKVAVLVTVDIKKQKYAIRATKVEESYSTGFAGELFQHSRERLTKYPDEFSIQEVDQVSLSNGKRFHHVSYRCNRFTYRTEDTEQVGYEELHRKYNFSTAPVNDDKIVAARTIRNPAGKVIYRSSAPAPEFEFYRLLKKYDLTAEEAHKFRSQMLQLRDDPVKLKIWFKDREKIFRENSLKKAEAE
ncbi:MAG: hypothetical protein J6S98_08065, partial [Lentisphaeria bacterium]|nr:hypothetical protein [Lentisphaeria bacterium]